MNGNPQGEFKPSLYDIWRELGEISRKVDIMASDKDQEYKDYTEIQKRITKLENSWGFVAGLGAAVSLIVSFLFTALTSWFKIRITQ